LLGDTQLAVGDRVRVLLSTGERMFALSAVVVRHDPRDRQGVFAVRFLEPSPGAQDAIQSLVLHRLRTAAAGHALIVVVDGKEGRLEAMVGDLQSLGRRALRVETALAAIACLQARGDPVAAVIVDERWVDGLKGLALLEFISMDYPSIRRIVACAHADPDCEVALEQGQVDALLEKPWSRDSLLRAIDET
jgi:CheY-like chemotaxis protein